MTSFVSMLRYACMLVFPEVVEYLYMCITEYYNIFMEVNGFVLECVYILVFSEVVECLHMSIIKL